MKITVKEIAIVITVATLVFLLASCSLPTDEEIAAKNKICDLNGQDVYVYDNFPLGGYNVGCKYRKEITNPVMDCIREYTSGIDEKYNNPDTVSNLREDTYSNVVKACDETFGKK